VKEPERIPLNIMTPETHCVDAVANKSEPEPGNYLEVGTPPGYDFDDPPRIKAGDSVTYECPLGAKFTVNESQTSQNMMCDPATFTFKWEKAGDDYGICRYHMYCPMPALADVEAVNMETVPSGITQMEDHTFLR